MYFVYIIYFILCFLRINSVTSADHYVNMTSDPASRQLPDFRTQHPDPSLLSLDSGAPVDLRDVITLNTDLIDKEHLIEILTHQTHERIPERVVHAKGTGAFGYFVVTNDVSKYTKADVFNGIGKKTPLVTRFSTMTQNLGGNDDVRETRGLTVKLYTNEGNLDFLCLHLPAFFYRDPVDFVGLTHSFKRNPRTNLFDQNTRFDFLTLRADALHGFLWLNSDYGIPRGYTRMDVFPIHTYEIVNKHGKRYYVRFNFRTEQGLAFLSSEEAQALSAKDPDYFTRHLYNLIEEKRYPTWRLEMDILSLHDIKNLDFNPFDVTRLWKNGTFHTEIIGRMIINRNVDNFFKDVEQSAYNPANLVPGITGPVDFMFQARRIFYRDTQNYRLGVNHAKIEINRPKYAKTYYRDGVPPVRKNMKDAPNYIPNSFNGPEPIIDLSRPMEKLRVLQTNAVDFEPAAYFYNTYVRSDDHRRRLVRNIATSLAKVTAPDVIRRALKLFSLIDKDLGRRIAIALASIKAENQARQKYTSKNDFMEFLQESKIVENLEKVNVDLE